MFHCSQQPLGICASFIYSKRMGMKRKCCYKAFLMNSPARIHSCSCLFLLLMLMCFLLCFQWVTAAIAIAITILSPSHKSTETGDLSTWRRCRCRVSRTWHTETHTQLTTNGKHKSLLQAVLQLVCANVSVGACLWNTGVQHKNECENENARTWCAAFLMETGGAYTDTHISTCTHTFAFWWVRECAWYCECVCMWCNVVLHTHGVWQLHSKEERVYCYYLVNACECASSLSGEQQSCKFIVTSCSKHCSTVLSIFSVNNPHIWKEPLTNDTWKTTTKTTAFQHLICERGKERTPVSQVNHESVHLSSPFSVKRECLQTSWYTILISAHTLFFLFKMMYRVSKQVWQGLLHASSSKNFWHQKLERTRDTRKGTSDGASSSPIHWQHLLQAVTHTHAGPSCDHKQSLSINHLSFSRDVCLQTNKELVTRTRT
jgi:hypothetical protein